MGQALPRTCNEAIETLQQAREKEKHLWENYYRVCKRCHGFTNLLNRFIETPTMIDFITESALKELNDILSEVLNIPKRNTDIIINGSLEAADTCKWEENAKLFGDLNVRLRNCAMKFQFIVEMSDAATQRREDFEDFRNNFQFIVINSLKNIYTVEGNNKESNIKTLNQRVNKYNDYIILWMKSMFHTTITKEELDILNEDKTKLLERIAKKDYSCATEEEDNTTIEEEQPATAKAETIIVTSSSEEDVTIEKDRISDVSNFSKESVSTGSGNSNRNSDKTSPIVPDGGVVESKKNDSQEDIPIPTSSIPIPPPISTFRDESKVELPPVPGTTSSSTSPRSVNWNPNLPTSQSKDKRVTFDRSSRENSLDSSTSSLRDLVQENVDESWNGRKERSGSLGDLSTATAESNGSARSKGSSTNVSEKKALYETLFQKKENNINSSGTPRSNSPVADVDDDSVCSAVSSTSGGSRSRMKIPFGGVLDIFGRSPSRSNDIKIPSSSSEKMSTKLTPRGTPSVPTSTSSSPSASSYITGSSSVGSPTARLQKSVSSPTISDHSSYRPTTPRIPDTVIEVVRKPQSSSKSETTKVITSPTSSSSTNPPVASPTAIATSTSTSSTTTTTATTSTVEGVEENKDSTNTNTVQNDPPPAALPVAVVGVAEEEFVFTASVVPEPPIVTTFYRILTLNEEEIPKQITALLDTIEKVDEERDHILSIPDLPSKIMSTMIQYLSNSVINASFVKLSALYLTVHPTKYDSFLDIDLYEVLTESMQENLDNIVVIKQLCDALQMFGKIFHPIVFNNAMEEMNNNTRDGGSSSTSMKTMRGSPVRTKSSQNILGSPKPAIISRASIQPSWHPPVKFLDSLLHALHENNEIQSMVINLFYIFATIFQSFGYIFVLPHTALMFTKWKGDFMNEVIELIWLHKDHFKVLQSIAHCFHAIFTFSVIPAPSSASSSSSSSPLNSIHVSSSSIVTQTNFVQENEIICKEEFYERFCYELGELIWIEKQNTITIENTSILIQVLALPTNPATATTGATTAGLSATHFDKILHKIMRLLSNSTTNALSAINAGQPNTVLNNVMTLFKAIAYANTPILFLLITEKLLKLISNQLDNLLLIRTIGETLMMFVLQSPMYVQKLIMPATFSVFTAVEVLHLLQDMLSIHQLDPPSCKYYSIVMIDLLYVHEQLSLSSAVIEVLMMVVNDPKKSHGDEFLVSFAPILCFIPSYIPALVKLVGNPIGGGKEKYFPRKEKVDKVKRILSRMSLTIR